MWRVILLFLLFFNFSFSGTLLIGEKESYSLLPLYEYSDDVSESNVSFWLTEHQWKVKKLELNTLTYHSYWIHFRLKNSSKELKKYFLISERGYTFSFDYYLVKNSKLLMQDSDDFFNTSNTSLGQSTHRLFPLSIDKNETLDLYFKVQNCNRVDIPFKLVSYKYLSKYNRNYSAIQNAYFSGF